MSFFRKLWRINPFLASILRLPFVCPNWIVECESNKQPWLLFLFVHLYLISFSFSPSLPSLYTYLHPLLPFLNPVPPRLLAESSWVFTALHHWRIRGLFCEVWFLFTCSNAKFMLLEFEYFLIWHLMAALIANLNTV